MQYLVLIGVRQQKVVIWNRKKRRFPCRTLVKELFLKNFFFTGNKIFYCLYCEGNIQIFYGDPVMFLLVNFIFLLKLSKAEIMNKRGHEIHSSRNIVKLQTWVSLFKEFSEYRLSDN